KRDPLPEITSRRWTQLSHRLSSMSRASLMPHRYSTRCPPPTATETMMAPLPHRALCPLLLLVSPLLAQPANIWTKHDKAAVVGRRWDVPLGYAPGMKRFLVLGGRVSYADARKERSYDVLSLGADHAWRNELPFDIKWGKEQGPFVVPAWKDE